jgi:serine/threonine protein phosphatase PrpC
MAPHIHGNCIKFIEHVLTPLL